MSLKIRIQTFLKCLAYSKIMQTHGKTPGTLAESNSGDLKKMRKELCKYSVPGKLNLEFKSCQDGRFRK